MQRLITEVDNDTAKPSERIAAANAVLDRALGRPLQRVETDNVNRNIQDSVTALDLQLQGRRPKVNSDSCWTTKPSTSQEQRSLTFPRKAETPPGATLVSLYRPSWPASGPADRVRTEGKSILSVTDRYRPDFKSFNKQP